MTLEMKNISICCQYMYVYMYIIYVYIYANFTTSIVFINITLCLRDVRSPWIMRGGNMSFLYSHPHLHCYLPHSSILLCSCRCYIWHFYWGMEKWVLSTYTYTSMPEEENNRSLRMYHTLYVAMLEPLDIFQSSSSRLLLPLRSSYWKVFLYYIA